MTFMKNTVLAVGLTVAGAGGAVAEDSSNQATVGSASSFTSQATFDGFYAGGSVSRVKSDFDKNCVDPEDWNCIDFDDESHLGSSSFSYGIRIGYDKRFDNFVLGILADFDKLSKSDGSLESIASLKLRAGYVLNDQTLFYGSLGRTHASLGVAVTDWWSVDEFSNSGSGNVFGLGVEHYLTANISVFGELNEYRLDDVGLYYFYDSATGHTHDVDARQVKFGLNYRF